MKTISSKFFSLIKKHKIWSTIIGLVVIVIIWNLFFASKNNTESEFVLVERGAIKEEVSVIGNVKPLSEVNLAFERGGRVSAINFSVGDKVYSGQVLAKISNDDLVANLNQAEANLKKVRASFGSEADKTVLSFDQAKISLLNAIKDSYTTADDAVRNKFYTLFTDPIRYNAKLAFSTDSVLKDDLEAGKIILDTKLGDWSKTLLELNNSSNLDTYYQVSKSNLDLIKSLLDEAATAVNGLSPETSFYSQTQIDAWKLNISTARTNTNSAIENLTLSYDQFKSANLAVKISQKDTLAEEASIEQAEAQVASAQAELAKSIIRSPINGVVTNIDMKLGEIVPMNSNVISVISYGDYEVESFVPEADISKVKIGNVASTTLDAYGDSVNFDTSVIKIDPSATVIEGVPTYKITLKFISKDDRVKSGMTANLDIVTAEKDNVLTVPARVVYSKNGSRYVKVSDSNGSVQEMKVGVGLRGSDGRVEIISGLKEGDKVLASI